MATIYKEFTVDASVDDVWSAIRDFGAPHKSLAPGFLTDAQLEGSVRTVTFFMVDKGIEAIQQNLRSK